MKRLLAYLFIVLGLGLTFSANSKETYGTVRVPTVEKCNSFSKGDSNWYYNNCDQLGSLKSAIKINKKEKVEYLKSNHSGYWQFMQFKINDLKEISWREGGFRTIVLCFHDGSFSNSLYLIKNTR